jgi:uncharacterized protein YegP (UPF0339 family)
VDAVAAFRIVRFESADGPRWRIVSRNGEVIATSEAYSSLNARDDTIESLVTAIKKADFEVKR